MEDAPQMEPEFGADELAGMFLSLSGVATVVSGATVFIVWLHLFLLRRYPVLTPPRQVTGAPERPIRVLIATVLMGPIGLLWPVIGVAYLVIVTRPESDSNVFLIIGLTMLALSLLLAALTGAGMWRAWRGRSARLLIGVSLATAVFFLTIAVILSIVGFLSLALEEEGVNFFYMVIAPMMVGVYSATIVVLLSGRAARAWFRSRNVAPGDSLAPPVPGPIQPQQGSYASF